MVGTAHDKDILILLASVSIEIQFACESYHEEVDPMARESSST